MTVDPFIEAEEVAGHSVHKRLSPARGLPVRLLRAPKRLPSARELSDAELTEKINAIHAESKGTYGAPRVHKELLPSPRGLRASAG